MNFATPTTIPGKPNTRRIVDTDEVRAAFERVASLGVETARFVINRAASKQEALSILDVAKSAVHVWEQRKA